MASLAARQHGNVSREQLLRLGLGADAIDHRVATGRLYRVHRGVYAVGRPPTVPLERAAAAVLAAGPHAVLSHRSALVLWDLERRWETPFEVTLTTGDRRPRNITVHRCRGLQRADLTRQRAIAVTSPARTLLDCAPRLTSRGLTRAAADGRRAGILTLAQLAEVCRRYPNHPGTGRLAALVAGDAGMTRSEFEDAFLALCRTHGLPTPQLNVRVCGYEVDALFAAQRVIVELDGWAYHQDRQAFERDREQDARLGEQGFLTVRVTHARMAGDPAGEAGRLARILAAREIFGYFSHES